MRVIASMANTIQPQLDFSVVQMEWTLILLMEILSSLKMGGELTISGSLQYWLP